MEPVLVVGARTTGLMMASELARRNIPVRVVDASHAIDPHVRANLMHSRTLEIFQGLGLADAMLENSYPELGLRFYANGELVADVPHAAIDSPFPWGQSQSQAHVERVLEKHLNGLGVQVERDIKLVAISQDDDVVQATLVDKAGGESVVETPWLIGCDGAHSNVRKLAGCEFPGSGDPYPYMLADVALEGELQDSYGHIFLNDGGELFIFSTLPGGRRLICANLPAGTEVSGAPTLEQLQEVVSTRGLPGLRIADPRWLAYFHIGYHLAGHFRRGRVFLAGDAAHIHSLLAGQGMNVGIQDACNLAWKLALVIRGQAPGHWLDTYEAERRPVGEAVVNSTRAVTENTELFAGLGAAEREKLLQHMIVPEHERMEAARSLQEVDLDYRQSPLCLEPATSFAAGPCAGAQAPDAAPLLLAGERTSLYRLPGNRHRLLLFNGAEAGVLREDLVEAARAASQEHGAWLEVFLVAGPDTGKVTTLTDGVTLLIDAEAAMHRRYGVDTEGLYLLRPDGYVAYRSLDVRSLGAYLEHAF